MGKGDLVKKIWRRTKLPRAQGHETKPVTSRTQGMKPNPWQVEPNKMLQEEQILDKKS